MTNNWRTIRRARQDPDRKARRACNLAWMAIGLALGWALARGL